MKDLIKLTFLFLLLVITVIFSADLVFAEDSTSSGLRKFIPNVIKNRIENRTAVVEDKIQANRERIEEKTEERNLLISEKRAGIEEKIEERKKEIEEKRLEALQRLEERKAQMKKKQESIRADVKERVRKSLEARYDVYDRAIARTGALLDKLQERVDKAREAGEDVSGIESNMAEAKAALDNTKVLLAEIKDNKDLELDKDGYQTVNNLYHESRKELQTVRENATEVIKELKSYNSTTSQNSNSEASTSSDSED